MEFKSFEKFNEFYGVGKYCIDGQVFISNFKNRGDGRFVPVGSPTQVFFNGMKRMLPKEC